MSGNSAKQLKSRMTAMIHIQELLFFELMEWKLKQTINDVLISFMMIMARSAWPRRMLIVHRSMLSSRNASSEM